MNIHITVREELPVLGFILDLILISESHMVFYGIQNFTMGIADPHVFDVPTICPKLHEEQLVWHYFEIHVKK